MKVAKRFVVGNYYKFTGYKVFREVGSDPRLTSGALLKIEGYTKDLEIDQWLDRQPRKCTYSDPMDGTAASFENLKYDVGVPITCPRGYWCYIWGSFFQELTKEEEYMYNPKIHEKRMSWFK